MRDAIDVLVALLITLAIGGSGTALIMLTWAFIGPLAALAVGILFVYLVCFGVLRLFGA